ncbi:hypothetical protein [Streptomyces sp. NPDC047130]|uniref:hypothetical protein n=1 Tax=Streptomyces sp. NPDC047130 TaxID=3155261 RepID=UPI003401CBC7
MDPAVIAALVAAPATVVAAAAAFAAGRAQARGAHRGPVDAVRRQHQRDAYASLLVALNAYFDETRPLANMLATGRSHAGNHPSDLILEVAVSDIRTARVVVSLEGPDEVAEVAEAAFTAAVRVRAAAAACSRDAPSVEARDAVLALNAAIRDFVRVAQRHLNSAEG